MTNEALFVESVTALGHRLRVDFFKLTDRYAHRLSVVLVDEAGRETLVPLAESVEGTADDPWPPSPPLQSLSIQKLADDRTAALLVGMAGRSHWSASIEAKPDESVKGIFEFDVACRCSEIPRSLSSTYRPAPHVEIWTNKRWIGMEQSTHKLKAAITCLSGVPRINSITNHFEIELPTKSFSKQPNFRWQYVLQLLVCEG